jgi:hypothetical protein
MFDILYFATARKDGTRPLIYIIMKRSELFMACANEYSYRCNSDCENCQLYLRYLKEKED